MDWLLPLPQRTCTSRTRPVSLAHHPQLHHAQILLGLIVRERHPLIPQKAHRRSPLAQPQRQIMPRSAFLAAPPPARQGGQRLVMRQRLPQQLVVAPLDPLQWCCRINAFQRGSSSGRTVRTCTSRKRIASLLTSCVIAPGPAPGSMPNVNSESRHSSLPALSHTPTLFVQSLAELLC